VKYLLAKYLWLSFWLILFPSQKWGSGISAAFAQSHPYQDKPLTHPDPSREAVALFRYLQDMEGKKILSGQMWAPWGISEINYLLGVTGRVPAVAGFDFIHESDNANEVQRAKSYWESGGIPTIMWHWGAPGVGEGYENSKVRIDINRCFQEGTTEYRSMWTELERKADHLEALRDAGVPILWRPFHELNGGWFWWGMQGPELFRQLWITMYDYFVYDRGLNNLIWVLCYPGDPDGEWYPGDTYVDIAGADTYGVGSNPQLHMYEAVRDIVAHNPMPIAYHECGTPPDPDRCIEEGAMWTWWMQWHTSHLTETDQEYLRYLYNHEVVVTRDEVPDIVAVYGWDPACEADSIQMRLQDGSGRWMETNHLQVYLDRSVLAAPYTTGEGSWHWSGCGVTGDQQEQTVDLDQRCVATVTFTNSCGATSNESLFITGVCSPTTITPYIVLPDNVWLDTTGITIEPGTPIEFVPQPSSGGTWYWSGPGLQDSSRRIALIPFDSATFTVTHTNGCGAVSALDFHVAMADHTGLDLSPDADQIRIYPTLVRNMVHVELPRAPDSVGVMKVYSSGGRMVISKTIRGSPANLDLSSLSSGNYLIRVEYSNSAKNVWVMKLRP
jgi:hypothetical protein